MTAHGFKGMASATEMGCWNPDAIERQRCTPGIGRCSPRLHACRRILARARQDDTGLGRLSRRIERRRESHPVETRECLRERQAGVVALSRRKQGFESPRERQLCQWLSSIKACSVASISNFSPIDSASEDFEATLRSSAQEAGSDLAQSGRAGIGACFLTMIHARIVVLPAEQIEHALCLAREEAAGLFSLRSCSWVCRQSGSRRAEARRNRSPRCLRGTMPRAPYLPE